MVSSWVEICKSEDIGVTPEFKISEFIHYKPYIHVSYEMSLWNSTYLIDNSIIIQNSSKWSLFIDPQVSLIYSSPFHLLNILYILR